MNQQTMIWIDALLAGTICQEDFQSLQETLRSDATALQYYCQQSEIHGRLEWELGTPQNQQSEVHIPATPTANVTPLHRHPHLWLTAAAVIVFMLGIAVFINQPDSNQNQTASSPTDGTTTQSPVGTLSTDGASVARLTTSRDARWNHETPTDGTWLKPGHLDLLSGSAEVTLDSGARVILQGPAKLELVTAHHARLTAGKATTHIPGQAAGFKLETPSTSFSDQDSSFAVAVAADGSSEVHVISGLVEATPRAHPELARVLSKNKALRLTSDSILPRTEIRHLMASFDRKLPGSSRNIPAKFLHWGFDSNQNGQTPETGKHDGSAFPARVFARPGTAQQASAKYINGKHGKAIRFNGRGAFLSSGFPGIAGADARTIAFWVRIPPDAENKQAYSMVAWGTPKSESGEKWQAAWNQRWDNHGQVGAIRTEFGGGYVIGSTDLRDGRWHHIACVFLGGESVDVATHIRHYVDGRLETVTASKSKTINTRLTLPRSLPTYFGRRLENDFPNYGFKGDMDEIYIIPGALTPAQVEALYLKNEPPTKLIHP